MNEEKRKPPLLPMVHTLIGLAIMFSGHFLPCPAIVVEPGEQLLALDLPRVEGGLSLGVTRAGMIVTMIFFGVVYLWTFVDTLWPGLMGIVTLVFSGYAPAPKVMQLLMGNPITVMVFFLFIVAAAIVHSNLAGWLGRYLMTREFINGRPWVFTAMILFTSYLVSFLDQTTSCFLMWPVMFTIFKETGFKKGDRYVSVMIVFITIMALLSFASDPFKGGAFYLLTNLQSLTANTANFDALALNIAAYLGFGVALSLCSILALLALMRYVLKVDVSPLLKLDPMALKREPLPPMNAAQKVVLTVFLLYAGWLLLPSFLGAENPVGVFMRKHQMLGSMLATLLLTLVFSKGRPVVDITVSNQAYPWRVFILIAVALLLGGIMTGEGTNISLFMEYALRRLLGGMPYLVFFVSVLLIGLLLTNFCNSVVLGLILTPILLAVATAFGVPAGPMMACFIFLVLIAACTPAASPFAAMMFTNGEWVDPPDIVRYALTASLIVALVVIVIGIPLAHALF